MIGSSDLSLLPALDALLMEGNVTRAAARMGISQPAMSAKLARLRDLTGDPLLVLSGSGRGMVPTPRAMLLRGEVRGLLAAADRMIRPADRFDPSKAQAVVRIIANDNAASLVLAVLLTRIAAARARGMKVALLRPDGRGLSERLETGDADFAIAAENGVRSEDGLHRHVVLRDRYATAQRSSHPRGNGALDLPTYCTLDHLIVSDLASFDGAIDAILRSLGMTRRVVLSSHSYALAPLIVSRSDLLVTLPRRLLERYAHEIDLFEPPVDLGNVSFTALWHDRTHDDPLNRWVRDRLFEM